MKGALVDLPTQQTNKTSEKSPSGAEGEIVKELNYPCVTASAASKLTPPTTTPPPRPPIVLLFIGIIFGILFGILFGK